MAKSFQTLTDRMSPERQARIAARAEQLIQEMDAKPAIPVDSVRFLVVTIPLLPDVPADLTSDADTMGGLTALVQEAIVDGLKAAGSPDDHLFDLAHVRARYEEAPCGRPIGAGVPR
jgi:hypothetical protein